MKSPTFSPWIEGKIPKSKNYEVNEDFFSHFTDTDQLAIPMTDW